MKVKSLFLSMCAIAALASCSQNEDEVAPPVSNATEARVTLQLEGDGVKTRANTQATGEESKVKDVTVFFFNTTDYLVGRPHWSVVAENQQSDAISFTTTTDAVKVVVITNLGSDLGASTFSEVNSLAQLKAVDFSSMTGAKVNQTGISPYAAGMNAITMQGDGTGKSTVALHFVTARIEKVNIKWTTESNTHYAPKELDLTGQTGDYWFAIRQVYVMKAQTNSPLIPAGAAADAWTGDFIPQSLAFAGGVAWGNDAPWIWTDQHITKPVQTNDYLVRGMPVASANAIANVLATPWYLFENPSTDYQTGIIIEIVWKSKVDASPADYLTKYLSVYFGEKKGQSTQPLLKAGNTYQVTLDLQGDFKPGGNAGGAGDNPDKPSVDTQINVSVTAAEWNTVSMSKVFPK